MISFDEHGQIVWPTREQLEGLVDSHREHPELPILACGLYLIFLFVGPKVITSPLYVKPLLVLWNFALALFSMVGTYYLSIKVGQKVLTDGLKDSICEEQWWFEGAPGFFVCLFVYSKFPELIDTVFLIIRKKDVIFLHWYHHVTVLLYCWHSLYFIQTIGVWFALVNFSVHSIMYTYYALAIMGVKAVFKISIIITFLQIAQMMWGIGILVYVLYMWSEGQECENERTNIYYGLGMYCSYFVLFGCLFYDKYFAPKPKAKKN